jgi:hypothetical protein
MVKVKEGDKVYVLMVGNNARYFKEDTPIDDRIIESTITKIGRKYFYLDGWQFSRLKFDLDDMCESSNYMAEYRVYLDKNDILKLFEIGKMKKKITSMCDNWNVSKLTYDQMKKICEILKDDK